MLGHGDWITDNLRWHGSRLLVACDWDSLIASSEAVIAGLAAAIYLYPALPTVTETRKFLDAYATARGGPRPPVPEGQPLCHRAALTADGGSIPTSHPPSTGSTECLGTH